MSARPALAPRHRLSAALLVPLDEGKRIPLFRQLYAGLRDAIVAGRIAGGARLPASRALALQLGVSRNTVAQAFDQLRSEGYIDASPRAGTFVAESLPDRALQAKPARPLHLVKPSTTLGLSDRGARMVAHSRLTPSMPWPGPRAFRAGLPALDAFPLELWARLSARRWRSASASLLAYGPPEGYRPLREAIAEYVRLARAARCSADQVIIVNGAQQALDLAAHVVLDPGDAVWMEDPGYAGAQSVLAGAGASLIGIPVDAQGLMVHDGVRRAPRARAAYVSPSHQYPLGVTLSATRRLELLEWARSARAWVFEDDYDSEFRYASRPLASLQGLDGGERVIYIGTFSKTLFPSLRLGYLVVPEGLVDAFRAARGNADRHSPSVEQAVVADFISEGHFASHIRRMRTLYAERQAALVAAAEEHLSGLIELSPAESGMHLVGWTPKGADDAAWASAAHAAGVETWPLSRYSLAPRTTASEERGALLLGYAAFNARTLRAAAERLGGALRPLARAHRIR